MNPATAAIDAGGQSEEWTVQRILQWTTQHLQKHGIESARLESEILLAHSRGCHRIELYTHFNEVVTPPVREKMRSLVKRRTQREPVAYLVGHKEFFSLKFAVSQGVFIPRPETESLVMEALEFLKTRKNPAVLELCSGSGCISVSIATQIKSASITAVELHDAPFETTQKNAATHGVSEQMQVLQGNLFEPLDPVARFDLLVSNPPYVLPAEIPELAPEISMHEPHAALDGGADGLDFVRKILDQAGSFMKPGGALMLEMDPDQIPAATEYASGVPGWNHVRSFADLIGANRFLAAIWQH